MTPKLWIRETIWVRIHQPGRMTKHQNVLVKEINFPLFTQLHSEPCCKMFLGKLG